jgi:hypothetical protein
MHIEGFNHHKPLGIHCEGLRSNTLNSRKWVFDNAAITTQPTYHAALTYYHNGIIKFQKGRETKGREGKGRRPSRKEAMIKMVVYIET